MKQLFRSSGSYLALAAVAIFMPGGAYAQAVDTSQQASPQTQPPATGDQQGVTAELENRMQPKLLDREGAYTGYLSIDRLKVRLAYGATVWREVE